MKQRLYMVMVVIGILLASYSPLTSAKPKPEESTSEWTSWATTHLAYVQVRSRCLDSSKGIWEFQIAPSNGATPGESRIRVINGALESGESDVARVDSDLVTLRASSRDGCKNLHVVILTPMSHGMANQQEYNHGQLKHKLKGGGLSWGETIGALATGAAAGMSRAPTPAEIPSSTSDESQSEQATSSGARGSSSQASSQNTSGKYAATLSQCVRDEYSSGNLDFVNSCNVAVYVQWTSDSGGSWGGVDIGPSSRAGVARAGVGYNPKQDGRLHLYACPKDYHPVKPDGSAIWDNRYSGSFECLKH